MLRDEKPQEMRQPNVFSKVSSQEDMRLARIKSTASGFAQSGFVKKELYAGFEIPAKETAMILRKAPFKKTAFRKQSEFFPRNTVSNKINTTKGIGTNALSKCSRELFQK